ncbi:fatty acid desaturase family protein [Streptomyces sp. NPDC059850]|uniref:fatty acid desaturase family protein n=1 Tax=Streptomyces sp. NPDC059850 TaxID=3346970 RepID=UPI00364E8161
MRGRIFTAKLALCLALTGAGVLLAVQPAWWARAMGVVLTGCMFAHAAELQHETLHHLAYRKPRVNRVVGVALGLPMLISFTAYQVTHLRHHRDLGTPRNREFFDYGNQYGTPEQRSRLGAAASWCVRFTMLHHYAQFTRDVARSLVGRNIDGERPHTSRRIRHEHLLTFAVLLALVAVSVLLGRGVVVWAWLLPLVLVAAPVHALVELPEHHRCETLNRSPFANTRTIRSNVLMTWFTNGNNYHVEHHLMPNLPIRQLPELHAVVQDRLRHFHPSYRDYFSKLIRSK